LDRVRGGVSALKADEALAKMDNGMVVSLFDSGVNLIEHRVITITIP